MTELNKILRYFAFHYPYKSELSKTRITKMVYLADWFSAEKNGKQLTKIRWYFDHYGPYVEDVIKVAEKDNTLKIEEELSAYNFPKQLVTLKKIYKDNKNDVLELNDLDEFEEGILKKVIEETKLLNFSEFIDYVYSTYPIKNQKKYKQLDLIKFAKEKSRKLTQTNVNA